VRAFPDELIATGMAKNPTSATRAPAMSADPGETCPTRLAIRRSVPVPAGRPDLPQAHGITITARMATAGKGNRASSFGHP
jgi:hypothetical protein